MNKVEKARSFALEKHGDQKYGECPYIVHLDMVHDIVKSWGLPIEYRIAAYLHDVIEDTTTTKEEIEKEFGNKIANLVFSVTGEGYSRKERKANTIQKLMCYDEGIPLKMADRFVNMRESKKYNLKLFNMYDKEMKDYELLFLKCPEYFSHFNIFKDKQLLNQKNKFKS